MNKLRAMTERVSEEPTTMWGPNATFDNPAHDFPQRIRYARDGDTMVATISAIDGSRAISWTFRRR